MDTATELKKIWNDPYFIELENKSKYMHKETGSIDTKENWILAYPAEELEERGLTAEECFNADVGVFLFEIDVNGKEI